MQQNAKFIRKLPIPMDIKKEFPVTEEVAKVREARVEEMRAILDGRDSRLMLIIGPCSADREDSVMDYVCRLVPLQEKVNWAGRAKALKKAIGPLGFPIIISLFGEEAAAVGMVYYMVNTICFWTIGVQLLREDGGQKSSLFSKAGLKKLLSPPLLGFLLGVVLVILGLSLPAVLANPVSQLGGCATPMAMMFVGCILRDADWSKLKISRDLLLVLLFRFIVCPALMLGVVYVMPLPALNKQVFFLLSSMPAMTQLSVMSKESGSDVEFASLLIAVTTVLSIFMIPVYAWIVTLVL